QMSGRKHRKLSRSCEEKDLARCRRSRRGLEHRAFTGKSAAVVSIPAEEPNQRMGGTLALPVIPEFELIPRAKKFADIRDRMAVVTDLLRMQFDKNDRTVFLDQL